MSKFDFSNIVDDLPTSLTELNIKVGDATILGSLSDNPEDYVVMPSWWKECYGVLGLHFGTIVQISGDTNSGKTTLAMQTIKAAQDQGYGIIYIETEGKTPVEKFKKWGIDPNGVWVASSKITEIAFDAAFGLIDKFQETYPEDKVLFVFDSYGNTTSLANKTKSMQDPEKVGGTAKVNRRALDLLVSRMDDKRIASLIVNYNYDNIGSHGKTNAGGKALELACALIIQSKRTKFVEKSIKGVKGIGATLVRWNTTKNHWADCLTDMHLPKQVDLEISDAGIKVV